MAKRRNPRVLHAGVSPAGTLKIELVGETVRRAAPVRSIAVH